MNQSPAKNRFGKSFNSLCYALTGGAFNDNFFKTVLALFITSTYTGSEQTALISLTGAMLVLPFILFSPFAGWLGDKFSKTKITIGTRLVEPVFVIVGSYFLFQGNTFALLAVLFMFGTQSALFSPSKYGLIPELLKKEQLSEGNAYVEIATFVGILMGTMLAGQIQGFESRNIISTIILFAVACGSVYFAFRIKAQPAANPNAKFEKNPFSFFWRTLTELKQDRPLFLVLLASAWFWFVGALVQLSIFIYAREFLNATTYQTGVLLTFMTVGVGLGSFIAGRLSHGRVELGIAPVALFGMSLSSFVIGLIPLTFFYAVIAFGILGFCSGLFIVPLNAYFQMASPNERRGAYLGTGNLVFNIAIVLASVTLWVFTGLIGLPVTFLYLVVGVSSLILISMAFRVMPVLIFRCFSWILCNSLYRLKIIGEDNIPKVGGALLVCNHISYLDAVFILAAAKRPVRFIMYKPFTELPIIGRLVKAMSVIPINENDATSEIRKALKEAKEAIQQGELVCIFAEGQLTRHGNMTAFLRGMELITRGLSEPIIPIHLDQIWGSIFSFEGGKTIWKLPKQIPYPVTVNFGKQLPSSTASFQVRQKVATLGVDSYYLRTIYQERLDYRFLQSISRLRFKRIMSDSSGKNLTGCKFLAATLALREYLKKHLLNQTNVGVLLPSGIVAAEINVALMLADKVAVNLNYTASAEGLASAIRQSGIKTVVSANKFLETLKIVLPEDVQLIDLEQSISEISTTSKLKSFATSLLPLFALKPILLNRQDSSQATATIIFSSGSSGEPKGVVLSHANISSNIQGVFQVGEVTTSDSMLGVLPFFHSFGYSVTLWFPLLAGIPVVYHNNPMDAGVIGELAEKYKTTMLLSTPTFLGAYIRKCKEEQFKSLRLVIVGAEKLPEVTANKFAEKFGVIPYEGYGCTELAPVISLNVPNRVGALINQIGNKPGKAGHPLPNITIKVLDPETKVELGVNQNGLVLVKSPSVMKGYLNNPKKTAEVMEGDWYITGDIGNLDEDGFLEITGRVTRFSKIAGEMIPHEAIESAILTALNTSDKVVAVTSVGDEKRGEKICVLYSCELVIKEMIEFLSTQGLPNLWIPKKDAWIKVAEIPVLGSGKLDLKAICQLAENHEQSFSKKSSEGNE